MSDQALAQAELVVRTIAQTAVDNEKYFCDLDAAAGDGDFGYSLARGFEIVISDWDEIDRSDAGTLLKKTAIILTKRIGGTSGPIWGTAFLRAGSSLSGNPEPSGADVVAALRAAIEGIKQRGSAELGDKTLLDSLSPAVDELELALPEGSIGRDRTGVEGRTFKRRGDERMLAQRGRAAYTGDRSRDSPDAGAIAIAVLFEAVLEAWEQAQVGSA